MKITRRQVLGGTSLIGLAALLPRGWLRAALGTSGWRFFTEHEAAVIVAATARLIPGPTDDPLEVGHPGAREAEVARYIDCLLSTFDVGDAPPLIFAGGPFSDRAGSSTNHMLDFLTLTSQQNRFWRATVDALRVRYQDGIAALDTNAGGDFTALPPDAQDLVLAAEAPGGFRDLLFEHAVEGMYCNPEYGGNRNLVGWVEIKVPGDVQPRGFTDAEVSEASGPDPVDPTGAVGELIALFDDLFGPP